MGEASSTGLADAWLKGRECHSHLLYGRFDLVAPSFLLHSLGKVHSTAKEILCFEIIAVK